MDGWKFLLQWQCVLLISLFHIPALIFILAFNFANRFSSKYFMYIQYIYFFVVVDSVVFHCVQYKVWFKKKLKYYTHWSSEDFSSRLALFPLSCKTLLLLYMKSFSVWVLITSCGFRVKLRVCQTSSLKQNPGTSVYILVKPLLNSARERQLVNSSCPTNTNARGTFWRAVHACVFVHVTYHLLRTSCCVCEVQWIQAAVVLKKKLSLLLLLFPTRTGRHANWMFCLYMLI